jgi:hypothetical protein
MGGDPTSSKAPSEASMPGGTSVFVAYDPADHGSVLSDRDVEQPPNLRGLLFLPIFASIACAMTMVSLIVRRGR